MSCLPIPEVACADAGRPDERMSRFAAALLDPAMPIPDGLTGPDGVASVRRFGVYRNNVVVGLVEALRAAYPTVCRIVGDAFFTAMARVHVAREPPRSPVMLAYGDTFPAFIDTFAPARTVPYLADVARIEWAWLEAYYAADCAPMGHDRLAAIDGSRVAGMRLALHPSLRIVQSPYPAVRIWRMNIEGGVPAPLDIDGGGEHALVVRPDAEVSVFCVPPAEAIFVRALMGGAAMAEAASCALHGDGSFDLGGALRDLLAVGAIVDVYDAQPPLVSDKGRCS